MLKVCKVKKCNKKRMALGYCPMHYARFKGYNKVKLLDPEKNIKKGYIIDKDGYKQIRINGKSRREHRVIMEAYLNRKLQNNEIVHHINEDKTDNRIENLDVMSFAEYRLLHCDDKILEKKTALNLYKKGMHMTEIPKHVSLGYSSIYWHIRGTGYPIRGIHNRSKVNNNVKQLYDQNKGMK